MHRLSISYQNAQLANLLSFCNYEIRVASSQAILYSASNYSRRNSICFAVYLQAYFIFAFLNAFIILECSTNDQFLFYKKKTISMMYNQIVLRFVDSGWVYAKTSRNLDDLVALYLQSCNNTKVVLKI